MTVLTATLVFAVVLGGSQIGFAVRASTDPGVWAPGDPEAGDRAVLLVGGFASGCCDEGPILQGDTPGLYVEQFSYWGLTAEGDPVPHPGSATDADLSRMARLMAAAGRQPGGADPAARWRSWRRARAPWWSPPIWWTTRRRPSTG